MESIGEQAFRECTSLKTVTLPSAVKVHDGETASFTVKAIGDGLKYQWVYKKSGSDTWYTWSDKTSASVSGSIPQSWNGALVRCRVTDSLGKSVYSDTVSVTVKPVAKITRQPVNASVSPGDSLTLSLKAQGIGLNYQWYFKKSGQSSFSVWKNHTHASETVTPNDSWNGIQLYCVVKDSYGNSVRSDTVTVTAK